MSGSEIFIITAIVWGSATVVFLLLLALDKLAGWLHKRRQNRRLKS